MLGIRFLSFHAEVHGLGGLIVQRLMRALTIVKLEVRSKVANRIWRIAVTLQIDVFVLDRSVDRAMTLLHELGHAFNIIRGAGGSLILDDQGNPTTSMANSAIVRGRCY